jgi:glycosyltransferase involved in cell wall biosynthesis
MKVIVHDYAGHPFQFDLSKELTKKTLEVYHLYTESSGGPKAGFDAKENLKLKVVSIEQKLIKKSNFFWRFFQEYAYGRKLTDQCLKISPDVIISANTPIPAQFLLWKYAKKNDVRFIFWLQDLISIAAENILKKKFGFLGIIVAKIMQKFERDVLTGSDHIITITKDFNSLLFSWGINENRVTVIPNWAPIEEIPIMDKVNEFSKRHNLTDSFNIIYSGTMGFKHNPQIIVDLASQLKDKKRIKIIVISEGEGMNYLKNSQGLDNLILLPFQPYNLLPCVLSSADILLTLLEPEAGVFSVPSKVWSSYCAGRASLLFVPSDNLASKVTEETNAGIVVHDFDKLLVAVKKLYQDDGLRIQMGKNARNYAETHFKIEDIAHQFIEIINYDYV